jgi:hypothetical protein
VPKSYRRLYSAREPEALQSRELAIAPQYLNGRSLFRPAHQLRIEGIAVQLG